MQPLFVRTSDQPIWRNCIDGLYSMQDLVIVKDKKGRTYLEGKVSFNGLEYEYFINRRKEGYLDLEISYGNPFGSEYYTGLLTLIGDWNYKQKTCILNVKPNDNYSQFERLLDIERSDYVSDYPQYTYDSWIYSEYGTLGLDADGKIYDEYSNCGVVDADTYDPNINYGAANDLGSGAFAGTIDRFVFLSGRTYASLQDNNQGNNPATTTGFWEELTTDLYKYSQERALFNFGEDDDTKDAKFDINFNYYYYPNCASNTYERTVFGYNIIEQLQHFLIGTDFSLSTDWLNYANFVNAKYNNTYIVNTERPDVLTLSELIKIVETLFNCEWRLEGNELTFKHYSELNQEYKGARPPEHDFSQRIHDIVLYKGKDLKEVYEHRLNFSKSYLETHQDSVLIYDNNYKESEKISGNFDVDFVFSMNKKGKNTPVIVDDSGFIEYNDVTEIWNELFVPSLLHESFYFIGREFKNATYQDTAIKLDIDYSEQIEFDAPPSLTFDNFNINFDVLLPAGKGRFEKIEFQIMDNKYKITCALKEPTNFYPND